MAALGRAESPVHHWCGAMPSDPVLLRPLRGRPGDLLLRSLRPCRPAPPSRASGSVMIFSARLRKGLGLFPLGWPCDVLAYFSLDREEESGGPEKVSK
eukprot:8529709-Pyramimonas_sp.AAC.1